MVVALVVRRARREGRGARWRCRVVRHPRTGVRVCYMVQAQLRMALLEINVGFNAAQMLDRACARPEIRSRDAALCGAKECDEGQR